MRHPRRFGLQGRIHDGGDLVDWILGFSSPAGSDVPQTVQPLVTKTLALENHRVAIHRKPLRYRDIGLTGSGSQNNSAAQSHLLGGAVRSDPNLDLLALHSGKLTCLAML